MFTEVLDSLLDVNTELMRVQCGVYYELEEKDNRAEREDVNGYDVGDDVFDDVDGMGFTGNNYMVAFFLFRTSMWQEKNSPT